MTNAMPETVLGLASIVIPCYRGEHYLAEAIESCLRQTYASLEVIVVDDGSPDACAEIAERYARQDARVQLVRMPENGGVSRAFNAGFERARGEYFTRLAQDDLYEPEAIARLVACLQSAPAGTGLAYCDYRTIDDAGNVIGAVLTPGPRDVLKYKNLIGLCVMWTRQAWLTCGAFDPQYDMAEDFEYWLRVSERFSIVKCDGAPAMRIRFHGGMGTVQFAERQTAAYHKAIIEHAHRGRFRRDGRWAQRQIALSRIYQSQAYLTEQISLGRSLGYTALSLIEWPWAFPDYARDGRPRWARARMLVAYSLKIVRSLVVRLWHAAGAWRRCRS